MSSLYHYSIFSILDNSHICVYLETQKLASDTALEVVEVAVKFIMASCNILLEFLFPLSQF